MTGYRGSVPISSLAPHLGVFALKVLRPSPTRRIHFVIDMDSSSVVEISLQRVLPC